METLVRVEDGKVYASLDSSWLKVVDGKIFVAAHPQTVILQEPDRAFIRAPLSYESWDDVVAALDFASLLTLALEDGRVVAMDLAVMEDISSTLDRLLPLDLEISPNLMGATLSMSAVLNAELYGRPEGGA